jgi:glycosyltransferase involved in cell wall biosynthesis
MKLIFAHDTILQYDKASDQYYSAAFSYSLWSRYLTIFNEMTVVSRVREMKEGERGQIQALSSGPNVSFAPVPSISSPLRMIKYRSTAIVLMKKALADADIVIARLPSEVGALAIHVAKKLGKPWAVELVGHVWDSFWHYGSWQGKVYAPVMTWRIKSLVWQAPIVLYVTEQFLQGKYPTRGKMISCSDVEIPDISFEVLHRRLHYATKKRSSYVIGLIGSMRSKYKGIDTAIRAIARLKDRVPAIKLRILGDGDTTPWRRLAEQLGVGEKVEFCGEIPGGQPVFDWLDNIDVYIQPSKTEGLPRSLIEAMSRGLPCFASRVGGIPELLPENCLIKAGDDDHLAQLFYTLYQDVNWEETLVKQNFHKASMYQKSVLDLRRKEFLEEVYRLGKRGSASADRL